MSTAVPSPRIEALPEEDTPENLIGLAGSTRRLLGYFVGYPRQVTFILFILALEMAFTAFIPLALKRVFDTIRHPSPGSAELTRWVA